MITAASSGRARVAVAGGLRGQRKFVQLWLTFGLFLLAYLFGVLSFPAMRDTQAFTNLLNVTPFLLICAVGETFVIISGGIDLSVSGIVALTTVATASLLQQGVNPALVIVLMLAMGLVFGLVMGVFITYLKVQPFIATLAGMWFARGISFVISDAEIRIYDPTWAKLQGTKVLVPILGHPEDGSGTYLTLLAAVALLVLVVGLYLAHLTRFGRTVYAIGGYNGANEQSSRLMGLSVNRTKVMVYMLSGFCSALAGLAYSIYVGSGHGSHAPGFELTVIAAVVIGGIALTGGEGYLIGALLGVLITQLIQTLIQFNGQLSSWWQSIVIGLLMLFFIGVQSLLGALNSGRAHRWRLPRPRPSAIRRQPRRNFIAVAGIVAVVALVGTLLSVTRNEAIAPSDGARATQGSGPCKLAPTRHEAVDKLVADGAVIGYERNGGTNCVDEVYAVYADGRLSGEFGGVKKTAQATPADVEKALGEISSLGWFTGTMYTTDHVPCGACYRYYTVVSYKGQVKQIAAVDGGTDAPSNYWLVTGKLGELLQPLGAR